MAKEEAPAAAAEAVPMVKLVAQHLIYHAAGKPPIQPGTVFDHPEPDVRTLTRRGAARRMGEPAPDPNLLGKPSGADDPPEPPPGGAHTMAVPLGPAPKPPGSP